MTPAEYTARKAHAGQVEKYGGHAYIRHIERVVDLVDSPEAKDVAWLHDVIEDTEITAEDLLKAGIHPQIVDAVVLLTRGQETYADYIETIRASRNMLALAVKMADLLDHLREETLSKLPAGMVRRYERALERLAHAPKAQRLGQTVVRI